MSKTNIIMGALVMGGLGGILSTNIFLPILVDKNFLGTAEIINKFAPTQRPIIRIEEKTVVISRAEYFAEAIEKIKYSVVAIQSFNAGKLLYSGSGLILTQDGIIIALNSLVPVEADSFQVIHLDEIYSPKILFRDYKKNLALLSISENNFSVAKLNLNIPELGQDLLVFSKIVDFGKDLSSVVSTFVSQVSSNFSVNVPFDVNLSGASLIDNKGSVFGLIDFNMLKTSIISSLVISEILETYLSRK